MVQQLQLVITKKGCISLLFLTKNFLQVCCKHCYISNYHSLTEKSSGRFTKQKQKLYCEMNDKIDTIRNFWRNRLVEGDTRSGLCVKLAVRKNLSK